MYCLALPVPRLLLTLAAMPRSYMCVFAFAVGRFYLALLRSRTGEYVSIDLQLVGRRGPRAARTADMTSELLWTAPSTCCYAAQARPTTYGDVPQLAYTAAVSPGSATVSLRDWFKVNPHLTPPHPTSPNLTRRCTYTTNPVVSGGVAPPPSQAPIATLPAAAYPQQQQQQPAAAVLQPAAPPSPQQPSQARSGLSSDADMDRDAAGAATAVSGSSSSGGGTTSSRRFARRAASSTGGGSSSTGGAGATAGAEASSKFDPPPPPPRPAVAAIAAAVAVTAPPPAVVPPVTPREPLSAVGPFSLLSFPPQVGGRFLGLVAMVGLLVCWAAGVPALYPTSSGLANRGYG